MANVYAGTSGWSYASWKPEFYPAKLPSARFLGYYASRLNTVEVNYTFRRYVTAKTLAGWMEQTPAGFRFSVKAHQFITHVKRLREAQEPTRRFLETLGPLVDSGRLGVVLFQLPPFLRADTALLEDFLAALPGRAVVRPAFEFRHPTWLDEAVYEILRRHNAALCVAESEDFETPDVATAGFCYYRFRKPEYDAARLGAIERMLGAHRDAGRDIFAYFKHEDTPAGALSAEGLLRKLQSAP